jgi:hypothetical protein
MVVDEIREVTISTIVEPVVGPALGAPIRAQKDE